MKIVILSLVEDIGYINLRRLSSYIKNNSHECNLVFLPRKYSEGWDASESYKYPYPIHVINQIKEICSEADIIGISLMSCHFDNAVHLTKNLKSLNKPIIWGGIHPTISPYECLDYTNMVCVGEGEIALVDLLNGKKDIDGIITKKNQKIVPGKRIENLDILTSDYDFKTQYIYYKNNIENLTKEIFSECIEERYRTSFSKGCVYSCTYCCNNALKNLYGENSIRWMSINNQLKELKWIKNNINGITHVDFSDDAFMSRSYEEISTFVIRYLLEINIPFRILATPSSITYEKLKILVEAGLYNIGIGIQSTHNLTRELYNRRESMERIQDTIDIIKRVSKDSGKKIFVRYDFILDNPWIPEDTEKNIRFAMNLPKPREIRAFSLVFYPGTELYKKAIDSGLIYDKLNQIYRVIQLKPKNTYYNSIFALVECGCPNFITNILLKYNNNISKQIAEIIRYFIIKFYNIKHLKFVNEKTTKRKAFNGNAGEIKN